MTSRKTIYLNILVLLLGIVGSPALAEECSHLWKGELETGTYVTRGMSGDTNAAYALLSFRPEANLTFVLEASYPAARFFSLESYKSRLLTKQAALLDYQLLTTDLLPSPFMTGNPQGYLSSYRVEASVGGPHFPQIGNFLELPFSLVQPQAIMLRVFDPIRQMTVADLPRVYALDSRTGAPRRCPSSVDIPFRIEGPQIVGALAPFNRQLNFGVSGVMSGQNSAIPGYAFVLSQMQPAAGAFIRFRTPRARYFSICVQDFLSNTTLGCLADRHMQHDANGFTYIAVSENSWLLEQARFSGWNALAFRRSDRQRVIGFVYRQIMPDSHQPYAGDFMPTGIVCHDQEFLARTCPF